MKGELLEWLGNGLSKRQIEMEGTTEYLNSFVPVENPIEIAEEERRKKKKKKEEEEIEKKSVTNEDPKDKDKIATALLQQQPVVAN